MGPSANRPRVGDAIGPYEIREHLGSGGMGHVYLAWDSRLRRRVALKTLRASDSDTRARLLREARAAARLNHPHIAAIHDVLDTGDAPCIVMEFVEGETLAARIARGPLAADEAVRIALQLARALESAHAGGILHRDLKAANVLVRGDGQVKVLDFGLAQTLVRDDEEPTDTFTATAVPHLAGTPGYMSPEQLAGRPTDARSDLYALGVVLFEMLAGRRPYEGTDLVAVAMQVAAEPPPSLRSVGRAAPPALERVVARLLARDRDGRYASAADVATDLERVLRGEAVAAMALGVQRGRRRARPVIAAALVLSLSGAGYAGWRAWQKRVAASEVSEANSLTRHGGVTAAQNDRAVALLESAVRRDPRNAAAHAALGDALWMQYERTRREPDARRAIDAAQRALALEPQQSHVLRSLALMHRRTGNLAQAEARLRAAIALTPDDDDAHRMLGRVLAERGRVDEGIAAVKKAMALKPDRWVHPTMLGFVLYGAGRYEEAATAYKRAVELRPDMPDSYQMLGASYHNLGDLDRAVGYYEHAVRLGPHAAAFSNLGTVYYARGRYIDAVRAFHEAIARDPRRPNTHMNLADARMKLGQRAAARDGYAQARDLAAELLKVNPQDAQTIALVALCEAKLGETDAAARHAAEATALAPDNKDVLFRSAEIAALTGDRARAIAYLDRAIAAGYPVALAREDDDLDTIRNTKEFSDILGRVR